MLHHVSNELVEEAVEHECMHIVFERLNGIRDRLPAAKAVHKGTFHRLYQYVTYKAECVELAVEQINPGYTSQRCSNARVHPRGQPSEHERTILIEPSNPIITRRHASK